MTNNTIDALTRAESFISGFEDDETQEGVADILAGLRMALKREQAAPDLLEALKMAHTRLYINDCEGEEAEYIAEIEAAIAKAEGRANA